MNDPIVEEVRRIRSEIAEESGHDLHRIFEAARNAQGGLSEKLFNATTTEEGSSVVREQPPET